MSRAMARQNKLEADLEKGFTALEDGNIEDAIAASERLQKVDAKDPHVLALMAAVADAQGEAETALGIYRSITAATPDDPVSRICAARIELRDLGDAEAALETVEAAFEYIDEERDLVEAILVRTEALITIDDLPGARTSLSELASSVIDEPILALDLAELALAAEDSSAAIKWIEVAKADEELEADAMHLLGKVHDFRDERPQMIAAWKRVRELDAQLPPAEVSISDAEVDRIATAALLMLPAEVREKLANVPILIDSEPSAEQLAEGIDPRILGLFDGSPAADDLAPVVTKIHLYKHNLERASGDLDELEEQITITVLHETAHYFGLDEEALEELGLG